MIWLTAEYFLLKKEMMSTKDLFPFGGEEEAGENVIIRILRSSCAIVGLNTKSYQLPLFMLNPIIQLALKDYLLFEFNECNR